MKNKISIYRNKLQLTQSELAEKSGLSLRTIQRIEAGKSPKGFTLKSLARALNVNISDLVEQDETEANDTFDLAKIKLVNISSLSFFIIPFGNIILPLIFLYKIAEGDTRKMALKVLSIQILWTVITATLLIISPFLQRSLATTVPIILLVAIFMFLLNFFIIIRNTVALNRKQNLYFGSNFSLL